MTSRERVKRAVKFMGPDRVPYDLPEEWGTDFVYADCDPDPSWHPAVKTDTRWEDEWGCIWEKLPGDKTMGQVKFHPLSDYSRMKSYKFPDYTKRERYLAAKKVVAENKEGKFVLAGIPFSLIHRLEYLRGHEAAWTDPYTFPGELDDFLDKFCGVAMESIERFAEIGIDGIISCDDWGLQNRLMVSPAVWEKVWKPKYEKVYRFARARGILTFLHSCGYITDILGGLIEAGLDVIQMDQQENMGVERLSTLYGGKICFWCPVDIQNTMAKGNVEDVKRYAVKLIDHFGKFEGGFIGKWYPSPEAVGHPREKIKAMADTFVEYGFQYYKRGGK
ncbi:MAG: uroporphyrinogen decarboxylase family protein [Candidatus Omnitrophota bacterium]